MFIEYVKTKKRITEEITERIILSAFVGLI